MRSVSIFCYTATSVHRVMAKIGLSEDVVYLGEECSLVDLSYLYTKPVLVMVLVMVTVVLVEFNILFCSLAFFRLF